MGGNIKYDSFVKKPNEQHEYTDEQILELHRCSQDPIYFIKNYIKIVSQDLGIINFDMYEYQVNMVELFQTNRFVICLLSRQSGKSTIVAAYALWYACFNDHKNIGIVSNKGDSAKNFLSRLKYMYENIPAWLKPGVPGWAATTIEFDNHTKIYTAATSKDSFRGEPMGMLLCDELAFVEPSWKADEFWASNYPTISASRDSKIIIISTPNGLYNKFHEIYSKAEKGENTFVHCKYDWTAVPGRDKKWADEQLSNLGPVKFQQEFGCCFIGSSNTIIDGKTLTRLMQGITHPEFIDMGGKLRLWEKPVDGAQYVLGVDTSKGVGSDFSVIQVFRIYGIKPVRMVQVAVWEDNFTDVYHFAATVNKMSYYFNNAHIMCENNSEGSVIVNRLWWDYENENLINTGTKNKDLGIRATTQTKPQAVLLMKKLIEDGSITLFDKNTIDQLGDFQDLGNNKYACVNCNDDCVTSMYWAIYILEQEIWEEGYEFNKTKEEDEVWGVLGDWADGNMSEDWSWMNKFTLN